MEDKIRVAQEMHARGKSYNEIADALNVSEVHGGLLAWQVKARVLIGNEIKWQRFYTKAPID